MPGKQGRPVRDWLRRYGDDAFWLVVAGIGFTLIVGSLLSLLSLDATIAFVGAAAVWLVAMWRVLQWRQRNSAGQAD